jgi:hypothetical protein
MSNSAASMKGIKHELSASVQTFGVEELKHLNFNL